MCATAAELKGRVVEQHSGLPVEQARIALVRLSSDSRSIVAETNDDGEFRATGLAPGRYRVEVSKQGFAASAVFTSLTVDTSVVIRLAKGGVISGDILAPDGAPVRDASVFALTRTAVSATLRRFGSTVRVDDRGHYRLYGLPPGGYAVGVSYSGAGTTSGPGVTVIPGTSSILSGEQYQGVSLTLTPGPSRSIEGRIAPMDATATVLITLALQDHPGIAVAQVLAEKDGSFRFDRVQAGSYFVFVAGPSDPRLNGGFGGLLVGNPLFGRAQVSVADQDLKDLVVPVQPGRTVAFRMGPADPALQSMECGGRAALQLTSMDAWGARIDRSAEVNAESAATISGLAPARYLSTVGGLAASCYYVGDPVLDLTGGVSETVLLRVAPGASLEGRLMTGGRVQPAAHVVVMWPETPADGEPACLIAVPDSEGRFSVEGIRPGKYRLLAPTLEEWSGREWTPDARRMLLLQLTPGITNVELPLSTAPGG